MKTITKTVYNFSELSDKSKDKARYYYQVNYFNHDLITEQLRQDLWSVGHEEYEHCFPGADLSWSLSSCQGDGVSFTGDWHGEELRAIVARAYEGNTPRRVQMLISHLVLRLIKVEWRYSHAYTVRTELEPMRTCSERLENFLLSIEETINNYRISVCQTLENYGYALIDDQETDENLEEFYDDMGIYFNLDGTPEIFHGQAV